MGKIFNIYLWLNIKKLDICVNILSTKTGKILTEQCPVGMQLDKTLNISKYMPIFSTCSRLTFCEENNRKWTNKLK